MRMKNKKMWLGMTVGVVALGATFGRLQQR